MQLDVRADVPSGRDFPSAVTLSIYVGRDYPYSDYAVFPEDSAVRDYPHQDAETGKLCLWPDHRISHTEKRLWNIVRSARQWLDEAARTGLTDPAGAYELPDFSRRYRSHFLRVRPQVMFIESRTTLPVWEQRYNSYGLCRLRVGGVAGQVVFVTGFEGADGTPVLSQDWGTWVSGASGTCEGIWILLDTEPLANRKRPCHTWRELLDLFESKGIDFKRVFTRYAERLRLYQGEYALMLMGFPVRQKYGDAPSEIHWQPIVTSAWAELRKEVPGFRAGRAPWSLVYSRKARQSIFADAHRVWWAKSTNVNPSRLFGRGSLTMTLADKHVALLGLGALGSHVANCLIREGVTRMALFDGDIVEPGNLCRHTANVSHIEQNKARAVRDWLVEATPVATIGDFGASVPIERDTDEWGAMTECDLWVDCTASERASAWLSETAQELEIELVRVYITHRAKYICICGSGDNGSAEEAHDAVMAMRGAPGCCIPDEFFVPPTEDEQFVEGPGCWHPTFPARLHEILCLVGFGVGRLDARFSSGSTRCWALVAGMRGDTSFGDAPSLTCYLETDDLR